MNVLYLTNGYSAVSAYENPSIRYRCYNPAEALSNEHHLVDVSSVNHFSLKTIHRYDVIVCHRPSPGIKIIKIVNKARQLNRILIADYDDLIFNRDHAAVSPGVTNRQYTLPAIAKEYQKNYRALTLFDFFSVSTRPLAAEIQKLKPLAKTGVIPNFISDAWLDGYRPMKKKAGSTCRITYLPGSKSHDSDFALVEDGLCAFMNHHPQARLRIIGPLTFDKKKFNENQLELMKRVPYSALPRLISQSRITIAPLISTLFNRCKSGLKFFESAAWGVPVIASPIEDMYRFKTPALVLADSADEWEKALYLMTEESYHEKCTNAVTC